MDGKPLFLLLILIMLVMTSGCDANSSLGQTTEIISTPINIESVPETSSPTVAPTVTPGLDLASIAGPLLLIQTDFDQYQYIDPKNQTSYPFESPFLYPQFRLRANLSPSGRQIFVPVDEHTGLIIDLRTSEVIHTYDFSGPTLFNPALAALKAEPLVTEMDLNATALRDAVTQAHQNSRRLLRWYQSDRYHLSVQDTGETSTSLFLDDHLTGTRLQLDNQPGLVEDYQISPDGTHILLKKGLVLIPGAYRDKNYYLINIEDGSNQPILLPENIQNPSVTWFAENTLGVTHNAFMAGGSGFSLINAETMQALQIIFEDFSELRPFGERLLFIHKGVDPQTTTFKLVNADGEPVAAQTIDRPCFYQFAASNRIIFQCELESFLLDQDLRFEPFIDSVLNLSPAPDGNAFVMINRSDQIFLLDSDLQIQAELSLKETPLEILWLPDSSGFLYRTHGRLFLFDLIDETNNLLIESDLFSDYTNLNAVWVTRE